MSPAVTRRTELPPLDFGRFRSVGVPVQAVQIDAATRVTNAFASDRGFIGKPGDWLVTHGERADGKPDIAIVDLRVFQETYEHLEGDSYRKRPVVIEAARLTTPLDIITMEGPSHGEPGDWVLTGTSGECYFNADRYFRHRYEAVTDDA
jgi:hypothetical protein